MPVVFSVIVPFHNNKNSDRRGMLDDLADTIPDRDDLEVLWIDDHSRLDWVPRRTFNHASSSIIQNHSDQRYAGTARNVGMDVARGTFLIFADSDDLFDTFAFNRVLDSAKTKIDAPVDLILFHSTSFKSDGTPGNRHHHSEWVLDQLSTGGSRDILTRYRSPWGKIIRSTFVLKNDLRFGPTPVANDVLFGISLGLANPRLEISSEAAYRIRQGNPSLTGNASWQGVSCRFAVSRQAQDLVRNQGRHDLVDPLWSKIQAYRKRNLAAVAYQTLLSLVQGYRIFPRGFFQKHLASFATDRKRE